MLERVGFPIDQQLGRAAPSALLHYGALPLEFSGDPGPRLSSITPLVRPSSSYEHGQPPAPDPASLIGDLCFPSPSSDPNSHSTFASGHASQVSYPSSEQEAALLTLPNAPHWVPPPMSYFNPYHVFGSRHSYENYIPTVGSPLRNALLTREPSSKELQQQFHVGLLGRRASFSIGAPPEGHYDEPQGGNQKPISSSQPAAQLSHYFPSGDEPTSSQSTVLSNHSVESPPSFRDGLPQPRNLPFRWHSSGSSRESSPLKTVIRQPSTSVHLEASSSAPSQSQKKAARNVRNVSRGKSSPGSRVSVGAGSAKPSKKRQLESPIPSASGKDEVAKLALKRARVAKVSESHAASSKPGLKPSKSLPKPANQVKKPGLPRTAAISKDTEEQNAKPMPSTITNKDLQSRLPTTRRVTRKVLRDAGGTADQLAHMEMEEVMSLQRPPKPVVLTSFPIKAPRKAELSHRKVGSRQSIKPKGPEIPKHETVRKTRNSKYQSSHKPVDSPEHPGGQAVPKDRDSKESRGRVAAHRGQARTRGKDSAGDTLDEISHESTLQASSLSNIRPGTLPSNSPCSEGRPVGASPQHTAPSRALADLDSEQIVLVADDMLKEVNNTASTLLDQFKADVGRGCSEDEGACFYLERLYVVRRDKWYELLLEQGA